MKRELTTREACHIYRNIFLFNLQLSLDDFEDREEKEYFYKDITEAMNNYLRGNAGWNTLQDVTYCYEDQDEETGPSVAAHLKLVEYLQKRNVI